MSAGCSTRCDVLICRPVRDAARASATRAFTRRFARVFAAIAIGAAAHVANARAAEPSAPPQSLLDTGLYAQGSSTRIHANNLSFSPQYPLWSDGASKRRWIYLPPGASIDASRPDAWEFPVGTRLWKEFALERRIETRYIERLADGSWRFAVYVWKEDGSDATLAPNEGVAALTAGAVRNYAIPSQDDCRACHEGAAAPVLGFSALQLSADRDPLAPHAEPKSDVDLRTLVSRGLIKHLPSALLDTPPRIATNSATERAALGYLHGNCAHCHNHNGAPAPVDLTLAQSVVSGAAQPVLDSLLGARSRYRAPGLPADAPLVAPGRPDASVLIARVRSREPHTQMPPLGTQQLDLEALALLERWIAARSHTPSE